MSSPQKAALPVHICFLIALDIEGLCLGLIFGNGSAGITIANSVFVVLEFIHFLSRKDGDENSKSATK